MLHAQKQSPDGYKSDQLWTEEPSSLTLSTKQIHTKSCSSKYSPLFIASSVQVSPVGLALRYITPRICVSLEDT